jgi:ribonuclease BN (tRNA processing enzyme)
MESNTAYLLSGSGIPTVLFDCGYQIPERLWKRGVHKNLSTVCITHLHADHVFGIVPLICRYLEEGRKKPLQIIGGRGTETYIRRLVEMGYPGLLSVLGFKIEFLEISETQAIEIENFKVSAAKTRHSVRNFTYRVDFHDPRLRSFAVSGDGQMTQETCALVNDVGVLFQEIYSLNDVTPVHMSLKRFEKWAQNSKVGRLGVSHHSRSQVDKIRKRVDGFAKKDSRWVSVKPGMKISLS